MIDPYTLVIFDPHTDPFDDFLRFDALGRMIVEEKPVEMVQGGDQTTLDSMSSYDKIRKTRLKDDIEATKEAQRRMLGPLRRYNEKRRQNRHTQHSMVAHWLEGNHEERFRREAEGDTFGWTDFIDFDEQIELKRWWDTKTLYGDYLRLGNIAYTHIPRSVMGRPMSHSSICKQTSRHLIYGHRHSLETTTVPTGDGCRYIVSAPAFMPEGFTPDWAKGVTKGWVYGLLKVRDQGPHKVPSLEYMSMDDLMTRWG